MSITCSEKTEGTPVGARQSATHHLAHAVLPQTFKTTNFVTPVAAIPVSQFTRLVTTATSTLPTNTLACSSPQPATITEINSSASGTDDESQGNVKTAEEPARDGHQGQTVVESYSTSSPIIIDPQKLDTVVAAAAGQHDWVRMKIPMIILLEFRIYTVSLCLLH